VVPAGSAERISIHRQAGGVRLLRAPTIQEGDTMTSQHYHADMRGRRWRVAAASIIARLSYRAFVALRVTGTITFKVEHGSGETR
jgi:hypothetical protein